MAVNHIINLSFQWNDPIFDMDWVSFLPKSQPMPNVCILTDSTAQFTQSNNTGHERVHVIPYNLQSNNLQEVKPLPGGFAVHEQLAPRVKHTFPEAGFSGHPVRPQLAAPPGSRSIRLAIMEVVE
jgi:hypothetical protein